MADYKLDCCGCFPNHRAGCVAGAQAVEAEEKRLAAKLEEEKKWERYFSCLPDEQLFNYVDSLNREIERRSRYVNRRNQVYAYMRKTGKAVAYLDRKRNDNGRKVQE